MSFPAIFTMIGVSSPERLAEFPDVPTFAEQIGPEYTFASSHGLVAPKRVPEDRILTMQNLVKEALAMCRPSSPRPA